MGTTVVSPGGDSAVGLIVGLILAAALIVIFVMFGLPYLRDMQNKPQEPTTINVTVPSPIPAPAPSEPSGN